MRANPGGLLDLNAIVGRAEFLRRLWEMIDRNSVSLEADRRVGKTSVLRKMCAAPPHGWEAAYLDVGKSHSADEFAKIVAIEVYKRVTEWGRQACRLAEYLDTTPVRRLSPDGAEYLDAPSLWQPSPPFRILSPGSSLGASWKNLLTAAIEDLVEHQAAVGRRVVLLFDELPWMLQSIAHRESPLVAAEILDVLRGLRQSETTGRAFRMLICGSIGMHHVLRLVGEYAAPLNDVTKAMLPPLGRAETIDLAGQLLASEGLFSSEFDSVTQAIADETAGYPYYVHWIVSRLRIDSLPPTPDQVRGVTQRALVDPNDPWDLKFYRNRITELYPRDGSLPLVLLDTLAIAEKPLRLAALRDVAQRAGERDGEKVRELLRLLVLDYFLTRDAEGGFSFRLPFLRRWWVHDRELA